MANDFGFELRLGPYEARLKKHFPALFVTGDPLIDNTDLALRLYEDHLEDREWIALGVKPPCVD